jgi:hypothetical protein
MDGLALNPPDFDWKMNLEARIKDIIKKERPDLLEAKVAK